MIPVATALLALVTSSVLLLSQSQSYTPRPGTAERRALMDALRVPVEKDLNRAVVFKVDHLKVGGDWAFMRGVPQQPGGKAMNYRGTRYQESIDDGIFDDWICALFRKENGKWRVIAWVIGATDVVYADWPETHGAPPGIFDLDDN